jgi:rhamnulokinase
MDRSGQRLLGIDLGAESGRAVVGSFDGERLTVEVVSRFSNRPVRAGPRLHWDAFALLAETIEVIGVATSGGSLASLAIDSWGVDYGLLDRNGALLGMPVSYRDTRTDGLVEIVDGFVPRAELYAATGIQALQVNTLYQLVAALREGDGALGSARTLLFIPDLLTFWLSGEMLAETTIASTSGLLDARSLRWARPLIERLGLPTDIFPPLVPTGTIVGELRGDLLGGPVGDPPRADPIAIVATAGHDTAAAVAGTPLAGDGCAFISCGTWSLVGVERGAPILTARSRELNFTNEAGVGGSVRYLRNVMGLWLVQGIRQSFAARSITRTYEALEAEAAAAGPASCHIDPDDLAFLHPADMVEAIQAYCRQHRREIPTEPGQLVRIALESLAVRYRWVIARLEELTDLPIHTIHIVGGGSANGLLCQLTANATGRLVLSGPVEATAIGNLLVQLIATGALANLPQARSMLIATTSPRRYEPLTEASWAAAEETLFGSRAAGAPVLAGDRRVADATEGV